MVTKILSVAQECIGATLKTALKALTKYSKYCMVNDFSNYVVNMLQIQNGIHNDVQNGPTKIGFERH